MSSPSKSQIELHGARYEGAADMDFSGKLGDQPDFVMSSSYTPRDMDDEDEENLILVLSRMDEDTMRYMKKGTKKSNQTYYGGNCLADSLYDEKVSHCMVLSNLGNNVSLKKVTDVPMIKNMDDHFHNNLNRSSIFIDITEGYEEKCILCFIKLDDNHVLVSFDDTTIRILELNEENSKSEDQVEMSSILRENFSMPMNDAVVAM